MRVPAVLLLVVVPLVSCATPPLYEAKTRSGERTLGLEVWDGEGGCPFVVLRASGGDWQRTDDRPAAKTTISKTLNRTSQTRDCDCAFDRDEPFAPADHFDLTPARAACLSAPGATGMTGTSSATGASG